MLYVFCITCSSTSLIVNLTSRLEVIEVELKQSRRVSSVTRTAGDNGKPDVTPRHHRRWTASSDQRRWSSESVISLPDSQRGTFTWQMPFTLKCIGTFRLVQCIIVQFLTWENIDRFGAKLVIHQIFPFNSFQ